MNLGALLSECYRRLTYPATPNATDTTRLTGFLNTVHHQLLGMPGLELLRNDTITFASVAGQAYYGLPSAITRVEGVSDRTSMIDLQLSPLQEIRAHDPGLTATGISDRYILRGYQQVALQPTAATGLWVVSSSATDTTQSIKVETVRTGGLSFSGAVTINGITRAQVGTLTDHIEVTKFYTSAVAAGDLSLWTAAVGGTQLATIPIGLTYVRYLGLQLYPTPASVLTYYVDYVRTIPEMSIPTDEPLLPDDFHWLLVEGALAKEWAKRDDDRGVASKAEYAKGVSALKYFVNCQADDLPVSGRGRMSSGRSSLGAMYPADRW